MDERDLGTALHVLQAWIADAIRLSRPITCDEEIVRRAEFAVIASARGMHAAERLDVYREQFWLRHKSNLRDDYPTVAWAIGAEAFEQLCTEFLRAFPPKTWDLQRLGADLPAYMSSHDPWQHDALATDAARLDWAFIESYNAPDTPPFDPRALSSVPEDSWPRARVGLHPSVRALVLAFPLPGARALLKEGKTPEQPSARPTRVVVWRDAQYCVRAAAVDPFAFALLTELEKGTPLGGACENVTRSEEGKTNPATAGDRVGGCFQEWTAAGWLSAVTFPL